MYFTVYCPLYFGVSHCTPFDWIIYIYIDRFNHIELPSIKSQQATFYICDNVLNWLEFKKHGSQSSVRHLIYLNSMVCQGTFFM